MDLINILKKNLEDNKKDIGLRIKQIHDKLEIDYNSKATQRIIIENKCKIYKNIIECYKVFPELFKDNVDKELLDNRNDNCKLDNQTLNEEINRIRNELKVIRQLLEKEFDIII